MRSAIFLLLMVSLSLAVTYRLDVFTEPSCPGDILNVDAIASDGAPVSDVELRLVLYEPFLGLRALKHTDSSGQTFFELTRNGTYRLYITSGMYNHEDYVVFEYPEMCPPPPPKQMLVDLMIECDSDLMEISITDGTTPLEGVFVQSRYWSTMSGSSGKVSLPLEDDDYFLKFQREDFGTGTILFEQPCPKP